MTPTITPTMTARTANAIITEMPATFAGIATMRGSHIRDTAAVAAAAALTAGDTRQAAVAAQKGGLPAVVDERHRGVADTHTGNIKTTLIDQ